MNYKALAKVLRYAETTEDDFHKLLDENPDDHHTRLVFADWLQDKDDPRAEGYRALGQLQKKPAVYTENGMSPFGAKAGGIEFVPHHYRWWLHSDPHNAANYDELPQEWLYNIGYPEERTYYAETTHITRREAEDAAALAFGQLPEDVKQKILKQK